MVLKYRTLVERANVLEKQFGKVGQGWTVASDTYCVISGESLSLCA